jgi:hypothetical protein
VSNNVLSVSFCNDCVSLAEFTFPFVSDRKYSPIFVSQLRLYSLCFPISYVPVHTQMFLSAPFSFLNTLMIRSLRPASPLQAEGAPSPLSDTATERRRQKPKGAGERLRWSRGRVLRGSKSRPVPCRRFAACKITLKVALTRCFKAKFTKFLAQ